MTLWTICNALLSLLVAGTLAYKLIYFTYIGSIFERIGIGLIAAGLILNIAPIIARGYTLGDAQTPFDDWPATLLRIGLLIYFSARMSQHAMANQAMINWFIKRKNGD